MNPDWIEHKRGVDGELLGWIQPVGEGFIAIDLLGSHRTEAVDWFAAEEALESLGIGYLADSHELLLETGEWLRVCITEVSTEKSLPRRTTGAPSMCRSCSIHSSSLLPEPSFVHSGTDELSVPDQGSP